MHYKDGFTTKRLIISCTAGRHLDGSMMELRKFMRDTYCMTGGENRWEGRELREGGKETLVAIKLYLKIIKKKKKLKKKIKQYVTTAKKEKRK